MITHPMDVAKTLMQTSVKVLADSLRLCTRRLTVPGQRPMGVRATLAAVVAENVRVVLSTCPSTRVSMHARASHSVPGLPSTLGWPAAALVRDPPSTIQILIRIVYHLQNARSSCSRARRLKVAPSCAIALTTFEAVRHFLSEKEWL